MNTFFARGNVLFTYTISVLAVLTFGCFLSTSLNSNLADVKIESTQAFV